MKLSKTFNALPRATHDRLRKWLEENPGAGDQECELFKLFGTAILRTKVAIEPPAFCSNCFCQIGKFSFEWERMNNAEGAALLSFQYLSEKELVPETRLCDNCTRSYDQRLEDMRKLELPPVRHRKKKFTKF